MPSDYKEICKDNIRRRGEDFEDIGRLLSEQLYNEKSHFVYELLQNAEDALERRFRQHGSTELAMFSASAPGMAQCSSTAQKKLKKILFSKSSD